MDNKVFVTVIFVLLVITAIVCGVFIYFFHNHSIGQPSDFADFATYFSGIVTPALTLGSVVALVLTLKHQREQLNEQRIQMENQRKADLFESYVERFEFQYKRYINLINSAFPHNLGEDHEFRFSLTEYIFLDKSGKKYPMAKLIIGSLPKLREIYVQAKESNNIELNDHTLRVNFFIDELFLELNGIHNCLVASYKFAEPDKALIVNDMYKRVSSEFSNLRTWNLIDDVKLNSLNEHIYPPEYIRKAHFDIMLIK